MTPPVVLDWPAVHELADMLCERNKGQVFRGIYGVPRGGHVVAALVSSLLGIDQLAEPRPGCLVVDDLIDSGATRERYAGHRFDALVCKQDASPEDVRLRLPSVRGWVVFPWETDEATGPEDAVRRMIQFVGENPDRDGLRETPGRVLRAWKELTEGYGQDAQQVLATTFEQDEGEAYDGIVVSRDIAFTSLCEHHLLPFTGTASVAYIPGEDGRIVGLSKLARVVELYARRFQVQERMTMQIAQAIDDALQPGGVAVVLEARHSCQELRGVRKVGSTMVTSEVRGAFRDIAARAEVMNLLRG